MRETTAHNLLPLLLHRAPQTHAIPLLPRHQSRHPLCPPLHRNGPLRPSPHLRLPLETTLLHLLQQHGPRPPTRPRLRLLRETSLRGRPARLARPRQRLQPLGLCQSQRAGLPLALCRPKVSPRGLQLHEPHGWWRSR